MALRRGVLITPPRVLFYKLNFVRKELGEDVFNVSQDARVLVLNFFFSLPRQSDAPPCPAIGVERSKGPGPVSRFPKRRGGFRFHSEFLRSVRTAVRLASSWAWHLPYLLLSIELRSKGSETGRQCHHQRRGHLRNKQNKNNSIELKGEKSDDSSDESTMWALRLTGVTGR